jgi:hypothetical protein
VAAAEHLAAVRADVRLLGRTGHGAGAAAVMGSWDTPAPGLSWLGVGAAGQGVQAAVNVGILMAGAKRPRLAHLKSPARARSGLVTRSFKGTQITGWARHRTAAPATKLPSISAVHVAVGCCGRDSALAFRSLLAV